MLGNQQCEGGCNNVASIYCDCVGRKVFLCDACFPNHRRKNPRFAHVALGVEVTTSFLIYQQRCAEFVKRKEELLGFLSKLEECSAELGRAVDEVMTALQTYCFQEVEASLNQENPALHGQYSPFLRGVQADCPLYVDFRVDTASIQGCMHNCLSLVWEKPQSIAQPLFDAGPDFAIPVQHQDAPPHIAQPQSSPQVYLHNQGQHRPPASPKYQRKSLIYSNSQTQVKVYEGYFTHNVAIKEKLHVTLADANAAISESLIVSRVKHLGTVDVYHYELQQEQAGFMSIMVMELLESDLDRETNLRAKEKSPWSEAELILYLEILIGTLAAAQQQGISHHDIKPQNVFCRQDGSCIKLGNFRASKSLLDALDHYDGSLFYISPQLKEIYVNELMNGEPSEDEYNPFKSDVYSLGLTFLFLARLRVPTEMTGSRQDLDKASRKIIEEIQGNYPILTQILPSMLAFDESLRCDFLQLQERWNKIKS